VTKIGYNDGRVLRGRVPPGRGQLGGRQFPLLLLQLRAEAIFPTDFRGHDDVPVGILLSFQFGFVVVRVTAND